MKRKININRPQISANEINQRKNFDSVLKHKTNIGAKTLFKKPWFLSSVVVASIGIVTSIVLLNQHPSSKVTLSTSSPLSINSVEGQQSTTTSDSLLLEAFYKAEKEKPCITPPISGLDIPYTIYKVKAENGTKLDFKTGSKLSIPKNAFVDANGNRLKGEIELRYREFHNPVDFFLSGIPMTYDSAGVRYHFESAGMMEILAFQDGKSVELAKGKSINVELASVYDGPKYNLYKLDTTKNNWACLGKDNVISNSKSQIAKKVDILENFNSPPPITFVETPKYKEIETKKAIVQKEIDKKIAALPKMDSAPLKPVKSRKEKFTFNIEVDVQDYPELAIYKGLLFEVGDENKNFKREMYDVTWDAATVKEGNIKGENYFLTLEKGSKKFNLVVYPVFEGKNYEIAMKDFQDKFSKYSVLLGKRLEKEKKIAEEYAQKIADFKNEQIAYERQWKAEQDAQLRAMSNEEKVMRVFSISNFGVFNCDHPGVYPQGVLCSAQLMSDKDKMLKCYSVYLVDKKVNGIFTYQRNPISTFSFNPKNENILWTVDNGVLYWLKPENFKSIDGGAGLRTLKMTRVDQKFTTSDEMKAYFNI